MDSYIASLTERIAALQAEAQSLAESHREDEANLIKIRVNILGVCKTVRETFVRLGKSDGDYLGKLDELRESWSAAAEPAAAHGDSERQLVEALKLETLAQARAEFLVQREEKS